MHPELVSVVNVAQLASAPLVGSRQLSSIKINESFYGLVKPLAEFILALVLLVLSSPLILVGVLMIRATSSGPAFYKQTRLGRGGKCFKLVKLRTMHHDCERQSGACWSQPGDPRVTRLGVWLRKQHIDELPQLWNVLCGEMSLVGPRPERPEIVEKIELHVPGYRERLRVRPGLTGLAQVLLPADTDIESVRAKVSMDQIYIRSRTAWLDVRLLLATLFHLLRACPDTSRQLLALPGPTTI